MPFGIKLPGVDLVKVPNTGGGPPTPVSVVLGGTGANNATDARINLNIEEIVAAISEVTEIEFISGPVDSEYIDVPYNETNVKRFWFDVDGAGNAPAAPTSGELVAINIASSANSEDTATAFSNAVSSAGVTGLSASSSLSIVTVTQPAGDIGSINVNFCSSVTQPASITTNGQDEYKRLNAAFIIDALKLYRAIADAVPFVDVSDRPWCKALESDVVTTSSSLSTITSLGIDVEAGKKYHFDFHGFYSTSDAVEDAGFAMDGPISSLIFIQSEIVTASTGTTSFARKTAWNDVHLTSAATARSGVPFRISGILAPEVNGTLYPRIKTEVSSAGRSTTIHAGSAIHLTPLD